MVMPGDNAAVIVSNRPPDSRSVVAAGVDEGEGVRAAAGQVDDVGAGMGVGSDDGRAQGNQPVARPVVRSETKHALVG